MERDPGKEVMVIGCRKEAEKGCCGQEREGRGR